MKCDITKAIIKLENFHIKNDLKYGSYSSKSIFSIFEKALEGRAKPFINVIPSEPGSGKSRGVQEFLKAYRDRGFSPAGSSVVVFVSRRDEIHSYIKGAELMGVEYAVLDSQSPLDRLAEYGGRIDPKTAPILLTTAQLTMSRCTGPFEDFEDLFYMGKPRSLRIWDESFRIAESVTVSADELGLWRHGARAALPSLATMFDNLEAKMRAALPGDEIIVPPALASLALTAHGLKALPSDPKKPTDICDRLIALSGKPARVADVLGGAKALVAEAKRLPADIAPLFVLDASARVDAAYDIMEAAGLPILKRPALALCYSGATFHHLKKGAGRMTMGRSAPRQSVILEAAAVINSDADKPWIIIYPDLKFIDIVSEVRTACVNPGRLEFVKWGDHRASNDLRSISSVMSLGLLRYSDAGYEGNHIKAGGSTSGRSTQLKQIRDSELQSVMLQAFARSNMRNHVTGTCGECKIYVIDSERELPRFLGATFPGCKVDVWKPHAPKLTRQQREVCDYLKGKSHAELVAGVTKVSVYTALGINKSNFAKLIKNVSVLKVLSDEGISVSARMFCQRAPTR